MEHPDHGRTFEREKVQAKQDIERLLALIASQGDEFVSFFERSVNATPDDALHRYKAALDALSSGILPDVDKSLSEGQKDYLHICLQIIEDTLRERALERQSEEETNPYGVAPLREEIETEPGFEPPQPQEARAKAKEAEEKKSAFDTRVIEALRQRSLSDSENRDILINAGNLYDKIIDARTTDDADYISAALNIAKTRFPRETHDELVSLWEAIQDQRSL